MKKQLLFTLPFLLTSLFISAQAIITTAEDVEAFNSTVIPGVVATADIGVFTTGGAGANAYHQLRGTSVLLEDLSGDITFGVATASGSIDGKLNFEFRKLHGSTASITISVAGYTDESFVLPTGSGTVNGFELTVIEFAQKITFTDTPLSVTFDIVDLDRTTATVPTNARLYNVNIDKTVPLSSDDLIKSSFAVYPNPATNSFKISAKQDIKNVQVFGINGRLLKTLAPATKYDISDLSSGLYLATINTLSGSETIKILKK